MAITESPAQAPPSPILTREDRTNLLKWLAEYQRVIESAQLDSHRRLNEDGVVPVYLVDYQELFVYMNENWQSETLLALEYLFSRDHITFVIGPGTILEILQGLSGRLRFDFASYRGDPALIYDQILRNELPEAGDDPDWRAVLSALDNIMARGKELLRLSRLLNQRNFQYYKEIANLLETELIDNEVCTEVAGILDQHRRGSDRQNFADALNFATVAGMRNAAKLRGQFPRFPYLLSHTNALTAAEVSSYDTFADDMGLPSLVSRSPEEALYSDIVLAAEPDSNRLIELIDPLQSEINEARNYTRRLRVTDQHQAHSLTSISRSPGRDNERMKIIGPQFRGIIEKLKQLIGDDPFAPSVTEVINQMQIALANRLQLDGQEAEEFTPKRLAELIEALWVSLFVKGSAQDAVAAVWNHLVVPDQPLAIPELDATVYTWRGAKTNRELLRIERYKDYAAITWQVGASLSKVVSRLNIAMENHNIDDATLLLGTSEGILEAKVKGSMTTSELVEATDGDLRWIRCETDAFTIYCELQLNVGVIAEAGVISKTLDPSHMIDFIVDTTSGFFIAEWLYEAFSTSQLGVTQE